MLVDDRLGLFNERHQGPVGYEFTATAAVHHGTFEPQLDNSYTFDSLPFPYHFALAAAYDTGQPLVDAHPHVVQITSKPSLEVAPTSLVQRTRQSKVLLWCARLVLSSSDSECIVQP